MTLLSLAGSEMLSVQYQSSSGQRGNVIVSNDSAASSHGEQCAAKMQQHKKKMYAQPAPYAGGAAHQPASVARRNARERNRVKQVNNGFATLRQHIPQSLAQALGSSTAGTQGGARAGSKKLSKVETLRMAVEYIRNLQQLLEEHDAERLDGGGGSGGSSGGSSSSGHGHGVLDIKFELKSESGDEHYQRQHRQSPVLVYVAAPCSEASASPTPSFVSDSSSLGGSYGANFSTAIYPASGAGAAAAAGAATAVAPADSYDNYEPMSPEEEVTFLDYISSNYMWTQAQ